LLGKRKGVEEKNGQGVKGKTPNESAKRVEI